MVDKLGINSWFYSYPKFPMARVSTGKTYVGGIINFRCEMWNFHRLFFRFGMGVRLGSVIASLSNKLFWPRFIDSIRPRYLRLPHPEKHQAPQRLGK